MSMYFVYFKGTCTEVHVSNSYILYLCFVYVQILK